MRAPTFLIKKDPNDGKLYLKLNYVYIMLIGTLVMHFAFGFGWSFSYYSIVWSFFGACFFVMILQLAIIE